MTDDNTPFNSPTVGLMHVLILFACFSYHVKAEHTISNSPIQSILSIKELASSTQYISDSSDANGYCIIFSCAIKAINNDELTIDYAILNDSSVTFCISHSLSGDSLVFQGYTLQNIECINHSSSDTSINYESNMHLRQEKRVYAGADNFFFIRFPVCVTVSDTLELRQNSNEGPLNFPPFCLQNLREQQSVSLLKYLSNTHSGTVSFYTRKRLGDLEVFIDGNFIGTIQGAIHKKAPSPDCGDIGKTLVNARISAGKHRYSVRNSKYTWEGEFHMLRESCIRINIED